MTKRVVFLVTLAVLLAGSALAADGSSPSFLERLLADLWAWLDGIGMEVVPGG